MTPSLPRALGLIAATCSALLFAGCDSAATLPGDEAQAGSPAVIQLSPEAVQLQIGDQTRLGVTAADQNGFRIPGTDLTLTWSSSDPSVVAVDGAGVVTARAAGAATISASIGRARGSAVIHTVAPTVSAVKLAQRDARVGALGDTVRLKAEVAWSGHGAMPAAWMSLDLAVARVDTQGLVTAVGAGTARIVASADAYADTGRVTVQQLPASVAISHAATTVNAIGDTLRLGATVLDANGHAVPGIPVSWTSLSPGTATVDPLGALVSRGVGLVLVTAAAAGHLDTASINVRQVPAAISVTPTSLATSVGKSDKLIASAADSNGVAIPAAGFAWQSSDTRVATVDGAGTVAGRAPGAVTVVLSLGGVSTVVPVRVDAAPVAAITLSPSSASLNEGATLSLDARLRDAAGNALNDRAVTWSSSRPAVATVGTDGVVRGLTAGSATITASAEGTSATATISVLAPAPAAPSVASLSVTPGTASAVVGGSVTLVATPRDAAGNALSGFTVGWTSQNPAVASVSKTGVVTALSAGTTIVSATSEGKTGSATLTITAPLPPPPAPVASITLSPDPVSLPVASTASLSAVLKDAEGKVLSGRALTWSSSKPAVATVSSAGVVTAVALGSATITATSEGKSGTSAVTITAPAPAPVATVTLSPTSFTLDPGDSRAISAFIKDASGNLLAERALAWSTSNAAVAKVSSDGTVTAIAAGTATITATSEGKSGVSVVTVSAPLGSPLPDPAPAPVKGVVFQDGFESGARTAGQNGYQWVGGSGITISNAVARSGRYSMEFRYPGKGLCEDASKEQRFKLGNDLTEVWLEYYVYLPKGGEGGSARFNHRSPVCPEKKDPNGTGSNNKFFALWGEQYSPTDNKVLFEYRRSAKGGDGDSYLYGMWCNDTKSCSNWNWTNGTWDPAFTDAMRGRWTQIRIHAKLADTKAAANGMLQLWADGALKIDMRNIPLAPDNAANRFFRNGYLMGWSNSGFNEDTSIFIDDFSILASNPGW